jgi:hypothetical protein
MHICKEDAAFKALKSFTDRKLAQEFKKWLLDCHMTFDQEIQYEDMKFVAADGKTYCSAIIMGKERIQVGDYVKLKLKGYNVAQLEKVLSSTPSVITN